MLEEKILKEIKTAAVEVNTRTKEMETFVQEIENSVKSACEKGNRSLQIQVNQLLDQL